MQANVRNETKKLIQKFNSVAVIKITDIRLSNPIVKLPGTKVFFRVVYCDKEYLNRSRNPDLNFSIFEIQLNESLDMQIQVLVRGLLVNEKEIGSCWVRAQDFEDRVVKAQVVLDSSLVGYADLVLNIFSDNPNVSTQSTCNSIDMRDECWKDASHIETDSLKRMNSSNHLSPALDSQSDLSFEGKSAQHILDYIQKVSAKKAKCQSEQRTLETLSQALHTRSLNLTRQRKALQEESNSLLVEKEKIQSTIATLNLEFSSVKREQFKNKAHKKLICQSRSRMAGQLNLLSRRTQNLASRPRSNYFDSAELLEQNKENIKLSLFGSSESVRPVNCCESPVPEDYFSI